MRADTDSSIVRLFRYANNCNPVMDFRRVPVSQVEKLAFKQGSEECGVDRTHAPQEKLGFKLSVKSVAP
jgi:hypothetical protein